MVELLVSLQLILTGCSQPDARTWDAYRRRFLHPEGRIVDTGNRGITHSEAQGYGMLLATVHGDREAFERLWSWTRDHLQVRDDALLAWRWEDGRATDLNNASDGDLLVAWALARAGDLWGKPTLRAAAADLARDLRSRLLVRHGGRLLLLPGAQGFVKPEGVVVNLSYWIWPALAALEGLDPAPEWKELGRSGLELLRAARFGRWGLPPDWLLVGETLAPAPEFRPVFGYNAVRIPLHLVWGQRDDRQLLQPYLNFWDHFRGARFTPAWTDLLDDSVDSYDAPPGLRAVRRLTRVRTGQALSPTLPLDEGSDYYSASLQLLARTALAETCGGEARP